MATVTDPNSPSDEELMVLVASGDDIAFRSLVERHQNLVIGTVARMVGPA